MFLKAIVVVMAAGLAACSPSSAFHDRFTKHEFTRTFGERMRACIAAPIVVQGRVIDVLDVDGPRTSRGDGRIQVQLKEITIQVERVIKGIEVQRPLRFYFFAYSEANHVDLGPPTYRPMIGQRRIYFLEPTGHSYRSIGDVTDWMLEISSGQHGERFCEGKDTGCCLAELLLKPGTGVDVKRFALDLTTNGAVADVLCSRDAAKQLLADLTINPDHRIRESAKEVLLAYIREEREREGIQRVPWKIGK